MHKKLLSIDQNRIAICGLFSLAFLYFVFGVIQGNIFASADTLQLSALLQTDGISGRQTTQYDIVRENIPWAKLAHDAIRGFDLPLWNRFQGLGAPLLGNGQSAVLFPANWGYIFSGSPQMIFVAHFLKLLTASIGAFAFFRYLGLSNIPAVFGAIAFSYSGSIIGWMYWAQSNTLVLIPYGALFTMKILSAPILKNAAWLGLVVALAILGGHASTSVQFVVFLLALATIGLIVQRFSLRKVCVCASVMTGALLFGVAIAAVQVVPVFEFILNSTEVNRLSGRESSLGLEYFPINFVPDLIGNYPFVNAWFAPSKEFNEMGMGYVGLSTVIFALASFSIKGYRELKIIFSVLALLFLLMTYDIPGVADALAEIPILSSTTLHRIQAFYGFCVVSLGAVGVNLLLTKKITRERLLLLTMLVFCVLLIVSISYAFLFFYEKSNYKDAYKMYFLVVLVGLLLNGVGIAGIFRWRKTIVGLLLLFGVCACETYLHFSTYLDQSDSEKFFPETKGTKFLTQNIGEARIFVVSRDVMPPNLGSYYKLPHIRIYDPLIPRYGNVVGRKQKKGDMQLLALLRKLGVKYYVVEEGFSDMSDFFGWPKNNAPVGFHMAFEGDGYKIIEDKRRWPRAFTLKQRELERSAEGHIVVPSNASIIPAEVVSLKGNRVDVQFKCEEECLVVLSDVTFPGWQIRLNGQMVKDQKVWLDKSREVAVRGALGNSGHSYFTAQYRPMSVAVGVLISCASIVLFLSLVVWRWFLRLPRPNRVG